MADFITDSFTGAINTLLSAHTGELGATWTITDTVDSLTLDGAGGVFGVFDTSNSRWALASGVPPSPNYSVRFSLRTYTQDGEVGSVIRCNSSGDCYLVLFNISLPGFRLYKTSGFGFGGLTPIAAVVSYDVPGNPDSYYDLSACGDRIAFSIDGVEQSHAIDTDFTVAGSGGIFDLGNPVTPTTGIHITKFHAFQTAPELVGCGCVPCAGGDVTFDLTSNTENTHSIDYLNGSGWITYSGPSSGNGTVTLTVASNSGGSYRQAIVTIVDATFLITQAGGC